MCALAGHMNHIYDDLNLSFSQLLDIFSQASSGNLKVTEKVDGQNLFFTYNVQTRKVLFARDEKESSSGGVLKETLNASFEGKRDKKPTQKAREDYQNVVDAFYMGMTAIEMAIASSPHDVVYSLFERPKISSEEDNSPFDNVSTVFINSEIMYSLKRNMIQYDGDFIVFHRFDMRNQDLVVLPVEELLALDAQMRQKFWSLVTEVEKKEQVVSNKAWQVLGPQERNLNNLEDTGFINDIREELQSILEEHGLTLDAKFRDYVEAEFINHMSSAGFSKLPDQELINVLIRAITDPKGFMKAPGTLGRLQLVGTTGTGREEKRKQTAERKKQIFAYHASTKQDENLILQYISATKAMVLQAAFLEPFAAMAPEYTARLMKGVESAFMSDSEKGTKIFRRTVELAIQYFQTMFGQARKVSPDRFEDQRVQALYNKYKKQMSRLRSVDNITTAMEGVVFEYPPMSNQFYKFTGGFAAANQILGYLGWDKKDELTDQAAEEINAELSSSISESRLRQMIRESITKTYLAMLPRHR